jgi:hypothetical protein
MWLLEGITMFLPFPTNTDGCRDSKIEYKYMDGLPSAGTFQKVHYNLDFQRGVRAFLVDGNPAPGAANLRDGIRIYLFEQAVDPPGQTLINLSGITFNTIHDNDFSLFEELARDGLPEPELRR